MRSTPAPAPFRRSLTCAIAAAGAAVALPNCSFPPRELVEGGRPYCDQLLGRLRTELSDLSPTSSESVDPAFGAWSDHVRTLAFECPAEQTDITASLSTIHQLEAEIAAAQP